MIAVDTDCADLFPGGDRATGPGKKVPAQSGKAIQAKWTTRHELAKLRALIVRAKKQGDLRTWRRGKAVWDYVAGKKVLAIAAEFEVARAAVNRWLRWYDTAGPKRCGRARRPVQRPGSPRSSTNSSAG